MVHYLGCNYLWGVGCGVCERWIAIVCNRNLVQVFALWLASYPSPSPPSLQIKLRHADQEIRLAQDPFPLYPGEILKQVVTQLKVVPANTALRLRAVLDFVEEGGTRRIAGDEWLFEGPGETVSCNGALVGIGDKKIHPKCFYFDSYLEDIDLVSTLNCVGCCLVLAVMCVGRAAWLLHVACMLELRRLQVV